MNDLANASGAGMNASTLPSDSTMLTVRGLPQTSLIAHYIRIARRWKWVVLAAIVIGMSAALVTTLLMTRQYSATATIEIAREEAQIVNVEGVEPRGATVDQEFYQTQYGLLGSRSLAERVASDLKLADNRSFLDMYGLGDSQGLLTDERPLDNSAAARQKRLDDVTEVLLDHLAISPSRMSRLVDLSFTSPDPELSAQITNAWARLFIETNIERRFEATAYAREFLENRLADLRTRLDESERELVGYAASQRIVNVNTPTGDGIGGERPIIADDLVAYNAALAQARTERIAAQNALSGAEGGGSTNEAVNSATLSGLRQQRSEVASQLARLRDQFEPNYPPVAALTAQLSQIDESIGTEEARISRALVGEFQRARGRENDLARQVATLKTDLIDLRRRSIEYNILQREVDTNQELYEGLLQRYKEIGIAGGVGTNNISIVDQAEIPERPSSPRFALNLLLGMLVGATIGAAIALALDQIDEAITDPGEMERVLGIPSLGVVPKLQTENPLEELQDRRSALTEAYLTIRTNLQFATPHGVPRALLITSTHAAEGKSTTAFALALALARQQLKVVIIDADMRSPSLHGQLGLDNDVGLSNILSGNGRWQDAVRVAGIGEVKVITAGPHPPNAADLLTGPLLDTLIHDLLSEFDHVVIDAPPLLGLADAPLIASKVGGVAFVVESYGVQSRSAKMAINRLLNSGAHLLGGILTKFVSNKSGYGYDYDYGYGYGSEKA